MKNSKYLKRGITGVLASAILMSSMPSYAATQRFKDVPTSHWAYSYIEDMAKIGFIKGVGDGSTFAPSGVLNFDAAMALLARLTKPTTTEVNNAKIAYQKLLTDLKIDSWAQEGIAVALYKNIITEAELKTIANNKQITKPITKIKTCEYMIKALDLEEEVQKNQPISLNFTDILSMSATQTKYVSVLIDIGVLDAKGQGDGTFGANTSLTRQVMAKMMAIGYEYIEDKEEEPTKPPVVQTETVYGTVVGTSKVGIYNFLTVNVNKKDQVYLITADTKVLIDGKTSTYDKLTAGQDVILDIKKGTTDIQTIDAETVEESLSGHIKEINSTKSTITVEYVENKKTLTKVFTISSDAEIYVDEKSTTMKNLSQGDKVSIVYVNTVVYLIEAEAKYKEIEGVIKSIIPVKDSREEEHTIVITDKKNKSYELLINEDTYIYRKDRRAKIADLKIKDEIYVEVEYDVVTELEANPVVKEIEGLIMEISQRFQGSTTITIFNQDTGKDEDYILTGDVFIKIDNITQKASDLKVGYFVEVTTEGDEITEIYADSAGVFSTIMGKVISITRSGYVKINVNSVTLGNIKQGDEITLDFSKAAIVNTSGKTLTLTDIKVNKSLNITGRYDGDEFIVETVILLN